MSIVAIAYPDPQVLQVRISSRDASGPEQWDENRQEQPHYYRHAETKHQNQPKSIYTLADKQLD